VTFDADSLGLQASALALVRDVIHERLGVYYENSRFDILADRIAPLVAASGFSSFLDYFYLLKYDGDSADQWAQVMDAISVPESYFWREMDQVHALTTHLMPELARRTSGPIRIWSVPCASGEEPLTLALVLDQQGWFGRATIEIHAGDASRAALARAAAGLYRERAFRSLPQHHRDRYFRACGDKWQVDPKLHARVTSWRQINLMDPADARMIGLADVIFCRNVFIYFSEQGVRQVVGAFADAKPAAAYLCVGASESLLRLTNRFELEEIGGAFIYVKQPAAARLVS